MRTESSGPAETSLPHRTGRRHDRAQETFTTASKQRQLTTGNCSSRHDHGASSRRTRPQGRRPDMTAAQEDVHSSFKETLDHGAPSRHDHGAPSRHDHGAPSRHDHGAPSRHDRARDVHNSFKATLDHGAPSRHDHGAPSRHDCYLRILSVASACRTTGMSPLQPIPKRSSLAMPSGQTRLARRLAVRREVTFWPPRG